MKQYVVEINNKISQKSIVYFLLLVITILFWYKGVTIFKMSIFIIFSIIFIIEVFFSKKNYYLFFLIKALLIIFLGFEVVFSRLMNLKDQKKQNASLVMDPHTVKDSIVGFRFKPNTYRAKATKKNGDRIIYNVTYSSDKFSRRINDDTTGVYNNISNKHLIFIGCSFTFGDGLNFHSTIPSIIKQMDTTFTTYNYGFSGWGPHQSVLLFQNGLDVINKTSISEDSGALIYTYIDDHLNRVFGSSHYLGKLNSIGSLTPDIYIKNNEIIIQKRSSINRYISNILNQSQTFNYFNLSFGYPKKESFYKRFADIINATYYQYLEQFPKSTFYVFTYPGESNHLNWVKHLDKNIVFYQCPTPEDYVTDRKKYVIDVEFETHPNKFSNTYYSDFILKQLKK